MCVCVCVYTYRKALGVRASEDIARLAAANQNLKQECKSMHIYIYIYKNIDIIIIRWINKYVLMLLACE